MKKLRHILCAIAIVISTVLCAVPAGAVGATTGEIDVVFLVDASRSMFKSDPDNIRLEAIKLFSDLCSLGSTKIGFVLFGSDIGFTQAPAPIDTEEDRTKIKNTVSSLTEATGATDIGRAVKYAVDMLASDEFTGNGKFIVFLSDGRTVINANDEGRTGEDSERDLESGIQKAVESGIQIYTIGLNASGDVDEEELRRISLETYADDTYMTAAAGELSGILSDIYVRHTGAETSVIAGYTSDGKPRDIHFDINDSSVVEANLVAMHYGGLDDIKLYDPQGNEVSFNGIDAAISRNDNYTLIKVYYPAAGKWKLSVASPQDVHIDIDCILTRDYGLDLTLFTDKAVGAGTRLKFSAALTGIDDQPIEDEAVLSKLTGRAIIRNTGTGESTEVLLNNEEKNIFRGEYLLENEGTYTVQASLYNTGTDVRSEIITLEPGDESYKEPEGPLKLILMIAGCAAVVIVLVLMLLKYLKENIRMWSGRLTVTINMGGMPSAPANYDFAKKVPGKRRVQLYDVMKDLYGDAGTEEAIPKKYTSAVRITMTDSGDLRFKGLDGIEYSGGVTLGKKVILSNANRLTLRYPDKVSDSTNIVTIQYMKT